MSEHSISAVLGHPPGSHWRDCTGFIDRVYVIDDRPCDWDGLVPAKLGTLDVLLREDDFGVRLRSITEVTET